MKIVFTPDWFLNNDVLIEVVSFMVLFLFFIFAIKSYRLSRKKPILYLGIGFLLIAVGELSTLLTKIVLYYDTTVTREIGQAVITYSIVKTVDFFYYLGFFFNRLFTLFGFYFIYKIPAEKKLEWLYKMHKFTVRFSTKRQREIQRKMREKTFNLKEVKKVLSVFPSLESHPCICPTRK